MRSKKEWNRKKIVRLKFVSIWTESMFYTKDKCKQHTAFFLFFYTVFSLVLSFVYISFLAQLYSKCWNTKICVLNFFFLTTLSRHCRDLKRFKFSVYAMIFLVIFILWCVILMGDIFIAYIRCTCVRVFMHYDKYWNESNKLCGHRFVIVFVLMYVCAMWIEIENSNNNNSKKPHEQYHNYHIFLMVCTIWIFLAG